MPHRQPTSNHRLLPIEKALAFMHGLLCDARKLTHVAYLRRDPLVPELLGIERVASQSALSRFFQEFDSAGGNLRCFRLLWHWGLDRLPSRKEGYTLDLESTRLAAQGWTSGRRWRAVTPSRGSGPVCIRCWRSSPRCGWWPSYLYALSLVWLNLSHYWYGVLPKWLAPH